MKINGIYIQLFALLLLAACGQKKQEPVVTPWGQITDTIPVTDEFDLQDIQRNGELIALTLTGPETYYDYHGRHLGTQYMLAQRFADKIGVSLRCDRIIPVSGIKDAKIPARKALDGNPPAPAPTSEPSVKQDDLPF